MFTPLATIPFKELTMLYRESIEQFVSHHNDLGHYIQYGYYEVKRLSDGPIMDILFYLTPIKRFVRVTSSLEHDEFLVKIVSLPEGIEHGIRSMTITESALSNKYINFLLRDAILLSPANVYLEPRENTIAKLKENEPDLPNPDDYGSPLHYAMITVNQKMREAFLAGGAG